MGLSPESIARRSARRPWITIGIWVAVFVVGVFLQITLLKDGETTKFVFVNNPESKRGLDLLEDRLRGPTGTNEIVIVESASIDVDNPTFQKVVEDISAGLAALGPEVIRPPTLTNYYQSRVPFLVSQDRRTTLIPFTMAGDFDEVTSHRVV